MIPDIVVADRSDADPYVRSRDELALLDLYASAALQGLIASGYGSYAGTAAVALEMAELILRERAANHMRRPAQ